MIEKPSIIITSGGRTGTLFFSDFFHRYVKDSVVFHEPESFYSHASRSPFWVIKKFGLYNSTVKKLAGKYGLTSLSNLRLYGKLDPEEASARLIKERQKFISSLKEKTYIESSYHYYGLIDIIPMAFKSCKIIYITRDGRDWVRSWMNSKGFYNRSSFHTMFNLRLCPQPGELYYEEWNNFDRFIKLCWAWNRINSYAFIYSSITENAKVFYFEDLFAKLNENVVEDLIIFINSLEGIDVNKNMFMDSVSHKINLSKSNNFPAYNEWSLRQKQFFEKICGDTMHKLGYTH